MMKTAARRFPCILLFIALAAQLAPCAEAQDASARYKAFDSKGRAVTLEEIVAALDAADVLFVGETHDDATAHALEADFLKRADERYSQPSTGRGRPVALSLEMFERDVQTIVDEYLAGFISERHFLLSSRPWNNYETDYRPMVEYARAHHLPVIAANAPARYVSRVSAQGPSSLAALSKEARAWLPPLPFPDASPAYAAKFNRFMQGNAAAAPQSSPHAQAAANPHGSLHLLEAQTLRDASMAYAVSEFLRRGRDPLVVQVNGTFHSEQRMGVPEQLAHYRKKARSVVVTIIPDEGRAGFDAASMGALGDFVILTDPSRAN